MESRQTLVGVSRVMREIQQDLECAIRTDARVLITGEPGVGKHAVARVIHQASRRSQGPLERCDCAGVPDSLLESELFGPGRIRIGDRSGCLERAQGGTAFLNDVGEMSLRAQVRLLRFLERGALAGSGSRRKPAVDVRLIAASSRSLLEQMAGGTFREDLFYRLNVIHLAIPALRERREDIPVLFDYFASLCCDERGRRAPYVRADVIARLTGYDWPGNVHELKRVVEQLVGGASSGTVSVADLPAGIGS